MTSTTYAEACKPRPYPGREATLAMCERIDIPLLVIDDHGNAIILRRTTDLNTTNEGKRHE